MICQFASPVEITDSHKQPEVFYFLFQVINRNLTSFILGSCFRRKILEKKI